MRNLQEGVGVGLSKLTKYLRYLREGVWELLVPSLASVGKRYGFDDKFADISLDLPLPFSTDDYSQLWQWLSSLGLTWQQWSIQLQASSTFKFERLYPRRPNIKWNTFR